MRNYRAHDVIREDRADGSILLRSAYPLDPPVKRTTDWLDDWARRTPAQVFLAERSGEGWYELGYADVLAMTDSIAAALLGMGLPQGHPIMIVSGNSVRHGLVTLAAQRIGVPTVPVAEQYALIPDARAQLTYLAELTNPAAIYAEDLTRFGAALCLPAFEGLPKVIGQGDAGGNIAFDTLLQGDSGADVAAAAAGVGPDTVAKILTTSGSTSSPKGVETTHRMLCANQNQIAGGLPFLRDRPPILVDWLPWNHVFGGSHNFNMVLANGGSLYVDFGKPVKGLVETTIENIRRKSASIAFNVPVGFAILRDAMQADHSLAQAYFRDLDMLFYAGASLPQDVWADLETLARKVRGDVPMFTSSWGLTETAPGVLLQHEPTDRSGVVGVPLPGAEVKLIPEDENRYEVRVRGPNIFTGYLRNPEKTAEAFDAEGFFIPGDAMCFVDPADANKGLRFDGRLSEDFKLTSGTWVRAASLRLELLRELAPLVQDLVVCGEGRADVALILFLSAEGQALAEDHDGLFAGARLFEALRDRLAGRKTHGSAARVARVIAPVEPPLFAEGEMTAKGNLNFRKVLTRRADLVTRLYDDGQGVLTV